VDGEMVLKVPKLKDPHPDIAMKIREN
jgi:hypothetical protein